MFIFLYRTSFVSVNSVTEDNEIDAVKTTRNYVFFRTKTSWDGALKYCRNFKNPSFGKGSLAIIKNEADLQSVRAAVPKVFMLFKWYTESFFDFDCIFFCKDHTVWVGVKTNSQNWEYPDGFYTARSLWNDANGKLAMCDQNVSIMFHSFQDFLEPKIKHFVAPIKKNRTHFQQNRVSQMNISSAHLVSKSN